MLGPGSVGWVCSTSLVPRKAVGQETDQIKVVFWVGSLARKSTINVGRSPKASRSNCDVGLSNWPLGARTEYWMRGASDMVQ